MAAGEGSRPEQVNSHPGVSGETRAGLEPAPTGDFPRFGGGGNGLSLSDFHLCDP